MNEWEYYKENIGNTCQLIYKSSKLLVPCGNQQMSFEIKKCINDEILILTKGDIKKLKWEERFDLRKEDLDRYELKIFNYG